MWLILLFIVVFLAGGICGALLHQYSDAKGREAADQLKKPLQTFEDDDSNDIF